MAAGLKARADDLLKRAGLAPPPPVTLVAAISLCAVLAMLALWRWWPRDGGTAFEVASAPMVGETTSTTQPGASASTEPSTALLIVHVVGSVRRPGVYRLKPGARAIDAVEAAGGLLADAAPDGLNLARTLTDGEQVAVPSEDDAAGSPPAAAASAGGVTAGGSATAGKVNINTADEQSLDSLPGVGPSTAQKIIADREANGPFGSVEDLGRVAGIGPKKLEQLADLVSVN